MKTFHFKITNVDSWALTDTEIIVIANNKVSARNKLKAVGYKYKSENLRELKEGVHIIQKQITE